MKGKRLHIKEDFTPVGEVVSISDMNGNTMNVTDAKNDKALPDKLNVIIEATHTGINRNKVSYSYDKLQLSTDSWTANYNKPVLLNHDSYSDPLGRVTSTEFKQSQIDPQSHCIQLSLEITNAAAIERFLDGRYKTFSIGGYTDSAVCSICGKDQMVDGWCGHSRGKKYDGKDCYWHLGVMDYDEISVVNSPADVHAQAISIEAVDANAKPEDSKTGTEGEQTDGVGNVDGKVLDNIDALLGHTDGDVDPIEPDANPKTDGVKTDGEQTDGVKTEGAEPDTNVPTEDGTNGEGNPPETTPPNQEDEVVQLQAQIKTLEEKQVELDASIVSKDTEIATKDAEIVLKDAEIVTIATERDSLKAELQVANEESQGLVKQNVTLAKFSHKVLCDKVAELQIAIGDKKLDEHETLITEYSTFTSKRLNDMATELMKPEKIAQRVTVASPGLVSDGDTEDKTTGGKTEVTIEEYAKTMTSFIMNKRL